MYSWAGCALHNSDSARCGLAHSCTMGRISLCLHCRGISLCPSPHCFLVFSSSRHLSPTPGMELPRRNHEPHTSPSALPAPGMLAGPGEGEPLSPGASVFAMPPDLVSALSMFPAPRAAPFPSPANTLETPFLQDSGSSSCCPLPGGVCPPAPQTLPPLAAAPRFPQQYSQALWPLQGTHSALVAPEASAVSDATSPLAPLKLPPPQR